MYRVESQHTAISMSLGPHESTLVVFTQAPSVPHAVHSEGGRVVARRTAAFGHESTLPVGVAWNSQIGALVISEVELPEPLNLDGPWTVTTDPAKVSG